MVLAKERGEGGDVKFWLPKSNKCEQGGRGGPNLGPNLGHFART